MSTTNHLRKFIKAVISGQWPVASKRFLTIHYPLSTIHCIYAALIVLFVALMLIAMWLGSQERAKVFEYDSYMEQSLEDSKPEGA